METVVGTLCSDMKTCVFPKVYGRIDTLISYCTKIYLFLLV